MGYTTDFVGHVTVHPPLNEAEQAYLAAFALSRRYDRPGGPYAVPGNPAAERFEPDPDLTNYNRVAPGQPSLWCGWQPSWGGGCLAHDGVEKFYGAIAWMAYLIDHFLAPSALARRAGLDCFAGFTFDHRLDGIVAACRRDTRELGLIRVEGNVVSEQVLVPAIPEFDDWGPLPYEVEIDEADARARRRLPPEVRTDGAPR